MQDRIDKEIWFEYSHSSGAGGQHINKNLTRVVGCFSIDSSACFTQFQKERLKRKLGNMISKDGVLRVVSQSSRSQISNKKDVQLKLVNLLKEALVRKKHRVKTKATYGSKQRRLSQKRNRSAVKSGRAKHNLDY